MQPFLSKLLTVDLPGLMVLPKRLEINIPPAVSAVAEAAVGRDAVMRAVASAVLQVNTFLWTSANSQIFIRGHNPPINVVADLSKQFCTIATACMVEQYRSLPQSTLMLIFSQNVLVRNFCQNLKSEHDSRVGHKGLAIILPLCERMSSVCRLMHWSMRWWRLCHLDLRVQQAESACLTHSMASCR